jgi:glycosyltransferase involved in cell wall biosynthesis
MTPVLRPRPAAGALRRQKFVMLGNTAHHLLSFRGPLLAAVAAEGHEVIAIGPVADDRVERGLARLGVTYETLAFDRVGGNPLREARVLAALVARLRHHQPDVFFSYSVKPIVYGGLAARLAGVPHIYAMVAGLGYPFLGQQALRRRALNRVIRRLYRLGLASCEAVFFQNRDDLGDFERLGILSRRARRVLVNGSGVDLEVFRPGPLPDGPPHILFAGRLLRDKGVFEFVEAARLVKARRPEVRFQLLGFLDPNPASATAADLADWSREGVVEYLGETHDVRPALAAASALVLPSYREGTPRSVLEAMAMGRPVIVTDVPGCRETVFDGDNGFLVPPYDASALAAAIERLLADPDGMRRMGRRARMLAEERFDSRKVCAEMIAAMSLTRER